MVKRFQTAADIHLDHKFPVFTWPQAS